MTEEFIRSILHANVLLALWMAAIGRTEFFVLFRMCARHAFLYYYYPHHTAPCTGNADPNKKYAWISWALAFCHSCTTHCQTIRIPVLQSVRLTMHTTVAINAPCHPVKKCSSCNTYHTRTTTKRTNERTLALYFIYSMSPYCRWNFVDNIFSSCGLQIRHLCVRIRIYIRRFIRIYVWALAHSSRCHFIAIGCAQKIEATDNSSMTMVCVCWNISFCIFPIRNGSKKKSRNSIVWFAIKWWSEKSGWNPATIMKRLNKSKTDTLQNYFTIKNG